MDDFNFNYLYLNAVRQTQIEQNIVENNNNNINAANLNRSRE